MSEPDDPEDLPAFSPEDDEESEDARRRGDNRGVLFLVVFLLVMAVLGVLFLALAVYVDWI